LGGHIGVTRSELQDVSAGRTRVHGKFFHSRESRSVAAIIAAAIVLLAAIEFHQYIVLAVRYPLYELITHDLLQALQILKSP
jgi:hypothetical protein